MQNFFLGDYIKQKRLDLGLTQEQLCDGIYAGEESQNMLYYLHKFI